MLKEKDQNWDFWERQIVLRELLDGCTDEESELILDVFRCGVGSISVGYLKNVPRGSTYLFIAGQYSYFALDASASMKDLYIVVD